jgi:hypothetical protein
MTSHQGIEVFWIASGYIFITISSASTQYYLRRRFALLSLTRKEIDRSNALLYKMLPEGLVARLKEVRASQTLGIAWLHLRTRRVVALSHLVLPRGCSRGVSAS